MHTRLRPSLLARYRAASAAAIIRLTVSRSGVSAAMPMLTVMRCGWPPGRNTTVSTASRRRSAKP